MNKQYRMADCFDLPKMFFGDTEQMYIAHAVNHYDAMQDRINELEKERDQLKAHNAELHKALKQFEGWHEWTDAILHQSPGACLAEIQAKAIEDFQTYFDKEYYGEELSQFIEQYADKLRQQSTISEQGEGDD